MENSLYNLRLANHRFKTSFNGCKNYLTEVTIILAKLEVTVYIKIKVSAIVSQMVQF